MHREFPTRSVPMLTGRKRGLKSSLKRKSNPSRVFSACKSASEWNLKKRAILESKSQEPNSKNQILTSQTWNLVLETWLLLLLGQALFQEADAVSNVRNPLLLIADFPLDAQGTAVANFLQGFDELADVYLALAQRNFFAPIARNGWSVCVLDLDAA